MMQDISAWALLQPRARGSEYSLIPQMVVLGGSHGTVASSAIANSRASGS